MSLGGRTSFAGLVAPVASVRRTVADPGVGPASIKLAGSGQVLRRSSCEWEPPRLWLEASPVYGSWDWWSLQSCSVHGGLGVCF